MSFRRFVLLALALAVSACAASTGTPFGEEFETATEVSRGNSTLIVRAELAEYIGESAFRAVEMLRQRWLRPRRGGLYPRVVVDGTYRTDLGQLRAMSAESVEEMRRLSASDATTKYGTGYAGGVIEVTTRGR